MFEQLRLRRAEGAGLVHGRLVCRISRDVDRHSALGPWTDGPGGGYRTREPWVQMLSHAFRRVRFGPESIREVVFGVEDGVVQNMVLIAGMVGAALSDTIILLAGSVNAIAGVVVDGDVSLLAGRA
ncbi:MAG: hypothetical protein Q8Q29_08145 [Actinomycetota bacterium]|nr:hypothetical protein [Actinomycetota bacterium]